MRHTLAWAGALSLALAGLTVGMPAGAHHSMAMFDNQKKVTVSGTVSEFQWTNPHAYIQLRAKDASGAEVEWSMEMGAPMYLYARGWRPSTLKAGSRVDVTIHPLRSGQPGGVVLEVKTPDGKTVGGKT